jgi:hypothetical protein
LEVYSLVLSVLESRVSALAGGYLFLYLSPGTSLSVLLSHSFKVADIALNYQNGSYLALYGFVFVRHCSLAVGFRVPLWTSVSHNPEVFRVHTTLGFTGSRQPVFCV